MQPPGSRTRGRPSAFVVLVAVQQVHAGDAQRDEQARVGHEEQMCIVQIFSLFKGF